jgi:hypothetical protein
VVAALGVAADGVAEEIDQLRVLLSGSRYLGLVHGDACPDNVRLIDGACWWLSNLATRDGDGTLPRLRATAAAMRDRLAGRWPGLGVPDYPALARAGGPVARIPEGWQPSP